jgi:hypothetical protein
VKVTVFLPLVSIPVVAPFILRKEEDSGIVSWRGDPTLTLAPKSIVDIFSAVYAAYLK